MTAWAEQSRPPQQGTIPDFFIVGQHKSGTTALYEMLRRHPEIYMPQLKEPRFFDSDLRPLLGSNATLPGTFDEYVALFAPAAAGQRVGEASPSYLRSRVAAARIAAVKPNARIIAILREPASLVRSLHFQLLKEHVESEKDLRNALAREQKSRGGQRVLRYSDHVRYVEQLRRYHAAFAPEQVLILIYDDFRRDNVATLRTVLRFLAVDDEWLPGPIEANPTVRLRSRRVDAVVRALYAGNTPAARATRTALRAVIPEQLREEKLAALRRRLLYAPPEHADEEVMRELRDRFRADVLALSEYLGRDLAREWGY